jgi:2,4-dienoyl-CoA reductase (NADPH2)
MVSMARPFLADAEFVNKAAAGRADEINTCIACNQACLDHIFERRLTPAWSTRAPAGRPSWSIRPAAAKKKVAVVGAGPAGLAFATTAAERGHDVTLFEAAPEIGGQFNLARASPARRSSRDAALLPPPPRRNGVKVKLSHRATAEGARRWGGFDHIVARHRHRAAHAGDSRHRPSQGGALHRPDRRPPRSRPQASPSSAPAASASTSPSS